MANRRTTLRELLAFKTDGHLDELLTSDLSNDDIAFELRLLGVVVSRETIRRWRAEDNDPAAA
jgi:hypothetical protein